MSDVAAVDVGVGVEMPTRAYVCPYCGNLYVRADVGRIHPEWETIACFDCAKAGVEQRPPSDGPEWLAARNARLEARAAPRITARGRRWNKRNGGTTYYAGEGSSSRL